jgi:iron complex transport system substrate-binding protein
VVVVVVGGLDTGGMTPREIDEYVQGRLAAGGSLYTLHERALADLQPDLILAQDLCAVRALPSGQVEAALGYLGCQAQVLNLDPRTLEQVLDSILEVGEAAGVPGRAERLVAGLRARLAAVAARVAGRPRPKVAVVEWVDPPLTAGHWVPDLVTAAGGTPVAACPGEPSVATSWAEIANAAPELVVVAPCGYHLDGAAGQASVAAQALPGLPVWAMTLTASSSAPAPGWSPGWTHSQRCCIPAPPHPPRPEPSDGSPEPAVLQTRRRMQAGTAYGGLLDPSPRAACYHLASSRLQFAANDQHHGQRNRLSICAVSLRSAFLRLRHADRADLHAVVLVGGARACLMWMWS